jgi:hypothetical protein
MTTGKKHYTGTAEDILEAEKQEQEQQEPPTDVIKYDLARATTEQRLALMSYLGDTEPLWNYQGETLTIVGVVAFDDFKRDENGVEVLDEDGALIPCKRTIWKGQLGKLWHSTSNVAYGFCRQKLWPVMTIDGQQGDLLAPVKIKIGSKGTKNGRRTFKFDIVSE